LVDNDQARYSVALLRDWKSRAEASALAELEGRAEPPDDFSAEIELSYKTIKSDQEWHDYDLKAKLLNLGTGPLGPFHIDFEMPAQVVYRPQDQHLYNHHRSTRNIAFFRVDSRHYEEDIYPGDSKVVMSVHYYSKRSFFPAGLRPPVRP
jgi:hypothetical protein